MTDRTGKPPRRGFGGRFKHRRRPHTGRADPDERGPSGSGDTESLPGGSGHGVAGDAGDSDGEPWQDFNTDGYELGPPRR